MTPTFDRRRAVLRLAVIASTMARRAVVALAAGAALVAVTALATGTTVLRPTAAAASERSAGVAAHARVTGSEPADGAVVAALPARVTVRFSGKPATAEGDPVQVYDPSGRRIDDGDVRVEPGGRSLSVGTTPAARAPGGYTVVFRVVSADTHVIAGRLAFEVGGVAAGTTGWMRLVQPEPAHGLRGGAPDRRPAGLAIVTALVAGTTVRRAVRSRSRRPAPVPVRVTRTYGGPSRPAAGG
jgi:methionine-rich copper-binding protein CopC